jgi:hypothetical protein
MDCGGLMETYCDYEENSIMEMYKRVEIIALAEVTKFVDTITKIFEEIGELE